VGRCWKGAPPPADAGVDAADGATDAGGPPAADSAPCAEPGCEGTACRTSCQAGQVRCGKRCEPESTRACGEQCLTCPGGASATCPAGRCGCAAGTVMCGGECKPCPQGCDGGECIPDVVGRWIPQEVGLLDVLLDITQSGRVVHLSDNRGKNNIPGVITRESGKWRIEFVRTLDLPPEWGRNGEIVDHTHILWWAEDPPIVWLRQ
jgi:hypothetical protein